MSNPICKETNCNKTASYGDCVLPQQGYVGTHKYHEFCKKHAPVHYVYLRQYICCENGCKVRAHFNYENEKKRLYCDTHKKDNMVNLDAVKIDYDNENAKQKTQKDKPAVIVDNVDRCLMIHLSDYRFERSVKNEITVETTGGKKVNGRFIQIQDHEVSRIKPNDTLFVMNDNKVYQTTVIRRQPYIGQKMLWPSQHSPRANTFVISEPKLIEGFEVKTIKETNKPNGDISKFGALPADLKKKLF